MAATVTRTAPKEFGSGMMWYKEVKADGTDLGTPDTWHPFPYIKDSELSWDFSASSAKTEVDEGSTTYQIGITAGGTKASFKGNFFTTDHTQMNAFFVQNRSKYYALIKEINATANAGSNYEFCFMPIATVGGSVSFKNGTTTPFEFTLNAAPASITLASTGLLASLTGNHATTLSTSFTIAVGECAGFVAAT